MRQVLTKGIVLTRTNFGEADRIITVLTPDQGKLKLIAKGVRRNKSKLAGGIELFSVSDLTFIRGKSDIGTLISSRLDTHYGNIVKDIDRTMLGYELLKQVHKATEDEPEAVYFHLLHHALVALDDASISPDLIRLWFTAQLLKHGGHTPNLTTDTANQKLVPEATYNFSFDDVAFAPAADTGRFTSAHIKVLRLLCSDHPPTKLTHVQGTADILTDLTPLITTMRTTYVQV